MTAVRQDAWTQDEDLLLAEIVLRHIREGSTQLKAFEEAGKKLSRTPAACGFRWNSQVRKQYKNGIELAKKQRKELKKSNPGFYQNLRQDQENASPVPDTQPDRLNFDMIISYLEGYKEREQKVNELYREKQDLEERIQYLDHCLKELKEENERLKKENTAMKDEYLSLLSFMEKARKLAVNESGHDIHPAKKVGENLDPSISEDN